MTMTKGEVDLRLAMLNTLLTCPHRRLGLVHPVHSELVKQDPRFYVRLAAWYADHGDVRDHKEMFIVTLSLSAFPGHRDVGLAMLRELPPYQVGRVIDFIHGKKEDVNVDVQGSCDAVICEGRRSRGRSYLSRILLIPAQRSNQAAARGVGSRSRPNLPADSSRARRLRALMA